MVSQEQIGKCGSVSQATVQAVMEYVRSVHEKADAADMVGIAAGLMTASVSITSGLAGLTEDQMEEFFLECKAVTLKWCRPQEGERDG